MNMSAREAWGRGVRRVGTEALRSRRRGPVQRRGYANAQEATLARPRLLRRAASLGLCGLAFGAAGAAATWQLMTRNGLGFYSDEESLGRFEPADDEARWAEETINKHPLVQELRSRGELRESRPHMKMPAQYRAQSLTGGALLGPGRLAVPPFVWVEEGGRSLVSVAYVGSRVSGHAGIVHGGLLATLLDEGLGRCSFGALPHRIGMTANLNIDYRSPCPAGSFLVLRAWTERAEGRKAWVRGRLELLAGPGETPTVVAEARALFVSPKYAAMMPRVVQN